jgi:NAD-dependent deacetylase
MKGAAGDRDFLRAADEAIPNPAHYALADLEEIGILKYLITQNIDNLHMTAGSKKVAEIHGNIKKVRCVKCNARYSRDDISLDRIPPRCPKCDGIIKSDIVMFGEPIPLDVLKICQRETDKSDCMLMVGTSALVYPAADFPLEVRSKGGILIEVNLYETEMTPLCDISLRGKAGELLPKLVEIIRKLHANNNQ